MYPMLNSFSPQNPPGSNLSTRKPKTTMANSMGFSKNRHNLAKHRFEVDVDELSLPPTSEPPYSPKNYGPRGTRISTQNPEVTQKSVTYRSGMNPRLKQFAPASPTSFRADSHAQTSRRAHKISMYNESSLPNSRGGGFLGQKTPLI